MPVGVSDDLSRYILQINGETVLVLLLGDSGDARMTFRVERVGGMFAHLNLASKGDLVFMVKMELPAVKKVKKLTHGESSATP